MNESIEDQVARAKANLEATRTTVARVREELGSSSVTTRSRDRSVEVTVGPKGELKSLKFLAGKYQTMDAGKLSAAVLEASEKARARMARQVMDAFKPLTEPGGPAANVPNASPDWEQIFGSLISDSSKKRAGSRSSRSELRDEIDEES